MERTGRNDHGFLENLSFLHTSTDTRLGTQTPDSFTVFSCVVCFCEKVLPEWDFHFQGSFCHCLISFVNANSSSLQAPVTRALKKPVLCPGHCFVSVLKTPRLVQPPNLRSFCALFKAYQEDGQVLEFLLNLGAIRSRCLGLSCCLFTFTFVENCGWG